MSDNLLEEFADGTLNKTEDGGPISDDPPLYFRCSLGKARWFWVVFGSFDAWWEQKTLGTGYALTAEDAEKAALSVAPDARYLGTGTAENFHRRLCAKRRAAKPASDHTGTTAQEFLYTDWWSDDGISERQSTRHLIVKKTKKRVFVENGRRYSRDSWDRKTYALDRADLEATGSVWSAAARDTFYTTPCEQRHPPHVSPDLVVLELKAGATKDDIKSAYRRLARLHHPDCSGDATKFQLIQAAYERAMAE
jgi:hypothetical protein